MKKILIVGLMMVASSAMAGHPRCAGSYEPAKCEAAEAQLAAETPAQRKERAKSLNDSRDAALAIARSFNDTTNPTVTQVCNPGSPYVGMGESSLKNVCEARWTNTDDFGSTVYRWYKVGYTRVMVKNGIVAAISY